MRSLALLAALRAYTGWLYDFMIGRVSCFMARRPPGQCDGSARAAVAQKEHYIWSRGKVPLSRELGICTKRRRFFLTGFREAAFLGGNLGSTGD